MAEALQEHNLTATFAHAATAAEVADRVSNEVSAKVEVTKDPTTPVQFAEIRDEEEGLVAGPGGYLKPRFKPDPKDRGEFEGEPVADPLQDPWKTDGEAQEVFVQVSTNSESEFQKAFEVVSSFSPQRLDTFDQQGKVISTEEVGPGRSDAEGPAPGRRLGR